MLSSVLISSGCTKRTIESINNQAIAEFDNHSIRQILNDLIQLDIDTYHVYTQAAKNMKDKKLKDLLTSFAANHEEHVNNLSKLILELKGHPPSFSKDFKGFVTAGYTTIKIAGGKLSALEAMETNEIISNRYYNKALSTMMPRNIKTIIRKNLDDEKRHLHTIQDLQAAFRAN